MPEFQLSDIFNVTPVDGRPGVEGLIVTARSWRAYQEGLGIKPEALNDKSVLNLGSGGSNIGKALERQNVHCRVTDLDLEYDPTGNLFGRLLTFTDKPAKHKLANFRRKIFGTEGRKFVQGNARDLPFQDGQFDYVLALRSTYQIPLEAKRNVYRELMRVGRILHLGPIFESDYSLLLELAKEENFEVVACQPMPDLKPLPFMFSSKEDYDDYVLQPQSSRISMPPKDDSRVFTVLGLHRHAGWSNGNTIVLRRNVK